MKKKLLSIVLTLALVATIFTPATSVGAAISEDGSSYTVEKGDSLYRIGKEVKMDWEKIAELNDIKEPWLIYPDEVLKLKEQVTQSEKAEDKKNAATEGTTKADETAKAEEQKPAGAKDTEETAVVHGEVAFDEIVYKRPDMNNVSAEIQKVQSLLDEKADADTVLTAYEALDDSLYDIATMINYAMIQSYLDATNTYYATEQVYLQQGYSIISNQLMALTENILNSYMAKEAKEDWGEKELEAIERANRMLDERTIELSAKEMELTNKYVAASSTVTVDVKGKKLTINEILTATDLSSEELMTAYYAYLDELNAVTGEIYLDLVEIRNQIADILEFDTYTDYCYFKYNRDYTKEQAADLHDYVKTYIVPIFNDLALSLTPQDVAYINSTAGDIKAFDPVYREFFKEISPDLTEAYEYMLKYNLYNFDISPLKSNLSYTTMLHGYHQPYLNIYATGAYTDINYFVHEFGHYNAFFKHDVELATVLDILEIHSQGLEMLFVPYFSAYGDAADSIVKYNFLIFLQTLLQGCLEDEFQQYIYSNDVTTVKELNELYYQLQLEYGLTTESETKESTGWVLITHTFVSPLYYISYATSLVPALEIFEMSTSDRAKAIEVYNALVDEGTEKTFLDTLKDAGLGSPFKASTIVKISEAIGDYFDLFKAQEELDPAA